MTQLAHAQRAQYLCTNSARNTWPWLNVTGAAWRRMTIESEIAEHVERLLTAPIASLGCRLLEVQFRQEGRWMLRLLVDRDPAINLDDLAAVSELAGRLLDVEDPIPQAFALEVTSPGLFRSLHAPKHYEQSLGLPVRLTLAPEILPERSNRTFRGVIEAVQGSVVSIRVEGADEALLELPVAGIKSAKLDPKL